jgi:predicted DNA-binding transcriptional regulator YafY
MRADRLISVLLMLQRRGQVTAAEVAEELEISERTARRDLDALAMAGVPVYSIQGRGGGWRLAGGGRIDLSGLHADEARALFLLAGPSANATPEVRSALRKLLRALPEAMQSSAEAAAAAVVVDPEGWDRPGSQWRPPLLDDVQGAVIDGECLEITYVARDGERSERAVHPLGVATKGRSWYLVADTDDGRRTFRIDRIGSARRTGRPVVRPEGFELTTEWRRTVEQIDLMRTPVSATATVSADAVAHLRGAFGTRAQIDPPDDAGEVRMVLRGHSVQSLAWDLAGFGSWVRVTSPAELRHALRALGQELVDTYRD